MRVVSVEEKTRVCAFLAVLGELLLENAWQLEETAGQVADLVRAGGRADRTTILTMQRFDRLKQEFEAIGKVLACYARSMEGPDSEGAASDPIASAIATITVEDLRERLLSQFEASLPRLEAPLLVEINAAEIGVDVIF